MDHLPKSMEYALKIVTKILKGDVKMKNNKGFTLIELIMVTIILGILAAVAAPRMLGTVQSAEEAAEVGVITALRAAVESYAEDKHITDGRYQYPLNPFDLVDVDSYIGHDTADGPEDLQDGDWASINGDFEGMNFIIHRRDNNEVYFWTYYSGDHSNGDADDRGLNIGDGTDQFLIYNDDGYTVDCNGNPSNSDDYDGNDCYNGPSLSLNGVCWNCDESDPYLSNNF